MANRPFFEKSTKQLEQIFLEHSNDKKVLLALKEELSHRTRKNAVTLKEKVDGRLKDKKKGVRGPTQPPLPGINPNPLPPLGEQGTLVDIPSPQGKQKQPDPISPAESPAPPKTSYIQGVLEGMINFFKGKK